MDETVPLLSGLKVPHIIHLLKFFLNSIHGFGLAWEEKQYFVLSLIHSCFWFDFHTTGTRNKLHRILLPPYFCPSKICWLLHQTKANPSNWYGIEKKVSECKMWGAHTTDNKNWPHFRPFKVPKMCLDHWLNSSSKIRRGPQGKSMDRVHEAVHRIGP